MEIAAIKRIRKGDLVLSVGRREKDGERVVSLGRTGDSASKSTDFFTGLELDTLFSMLLRDRRRDFRIPFTSSRAVAQDDSHYDEERTYWEIRRAIEEVREADLSETGTRKRPVTITVVSPMPKFTWAHTCPKCGCHVESQLRMYGTALKLCSNCQYVHAASPGA